MADFKQVKLKNGTTILVKDAAARASIAALQQNIADAAFSSTDSLDPSVCLKIGRKIVGFSFTGSNGVTVASDGDRVIDIYGNEAGILHAAATDAQTKADAALTSAKKYTDDELAEFLATYITADDPKGAIDKMQEIAAWINNAGSDATTLLADVESLKSRVTGLDSQDGTFANQLATIFQEVWGNTTGTGDSRLDELANALASLAATYDSSTETITLPI